MSEKEYPTLQLIGDTDENTVEVKLSDLPELHGEICSRNGGTVVSSTNGSLPLLGRAAYLSERFNHRIVEFDGRPYLISTPKK